MSRWCGVAWVLGGLLLGIGPAAWAVSARAQLATDTCGALEQATRAYPGTDPVLLTSYPALDGQPPAILALRGVAFTYDNALASIALFACGKAQSARRLADALAFAVEHDPEYADGRLRNAYAAGPIKGRAMGLSGYWSTERNAWSQDAYQVGSATGNQAWGALALLEAFRQTAEPSYLAAARRVLRWVQQNTYDNQVPLGFSGGVYGYLHQQVRQGWKSTEHNIDLVAAWIALDRLTADPDARLQAQVALGFVQSQWDEREGRFLIGTGEDGRTSDRLRSGLDAQLWPLLAVPDPPRDWRRVFAFIDQNHRFAGGYGFNRNPDGVWTEGTAQAAAVARLSGLPDRAQPLWPMLLALQAGHGWLFATPQAQISTGLAIGPDSPRNDFFYYHLPHLGATAWAAIAAAGVNPFTGAQEAD